MFASLCQSVKPDLELIDTSDLYTAYEKYVSEIQEMLPSPCDGELKLVFRETKGKFYNFKVSIVFVFIVNSKLDYFYIHIPLSQNCIKKGKNSKN